MGSWLAPRCPGVQARGLPHHFCSPMPLIATCSCSGQAQAEVIYSTEPRGHAAAGAAPLGDIQAGFEAREVVPKWVLGEDDPHKSAHHPSSRGFSSASLQPPTAECRQLCPNTDIPVLEAPDTSSPLSLPSGRVGKGDSKKTISSRGIRRAGWEREEKGVLAAAWWSQSIITTL